MPAFPIAVPFADMPVRSHNKAKVTCFENMVLGEMLL